MKTREKEKKNRNNLKRYDNVGRSGGGIEEGKKKNKRAEVKQLSRQSLFSAKDFLGDARNMTHCFCPYCETQTKMSCTEKERKKKDISAWLPQFPSRAKMFRTISREPVCLTWIFADKAKIDCGEAIKRRIKDCQSVWNHMGECWRMLVLAAQFHGRQLPTVSRLFSLQLGPSLQVLIS